MFRLVGSLARISLIMAHVTLEPYKARKSALSGQRNVISAPRMMIAVEKILLYGDGWTLVRRWTGFQKKKVHPCVFLYLNPGRRRSQLVAGRDSPRRHPL